MRLAPRVKKSGAATGSRPHLSTGSTVEVGRHPGVEATWIGSWCGGGGGGEKWNVCHRPQKDPKPIYATVLPALRKPRCSRALSCCLSLSPSLSSLS